MTRTLLVIDIQNDYFAGGALPLWQAAETEARIVAAIGKARAAGDRVVLIQHVSKAPAGPFLPDTAGVAIRPAILKAADGAPIVTKSYADAFQDTDLPTHLSGSRTLLVAGMMTQNCVVFTALSRSADAFDVQVVPDLCTAPAEIVHRIALNALGSKLALRNAEDVWRIEGR
ncbi:cysteine hydrolase family protein [Brevundimonas sp. SORGH_AS_0993]|uniref:cysteine hydrolase family protein n=1 Tax=Brevundimonas sp. SORGH_AS_0993 TaxID=3041794 RepID=UPI0027862D69|nr:isochorismatase family protein [Brevundimonas sp. SORGH_AS_0993]MDQ1152817.1 nicotinamidase-related amidase [Brevundimonas sp. SORGH_AS_0993]